MNTYEDTKLKALKEIEVIMIKNRKQMHHSILNIALLVFM